MEKLKEFLGTSLGCLFAALIFIYGISQLYAGYLGIEHHCGKGWAIAAVVALILLRFSLPLSIGSFFGAMNVWGWPWYFALAFALPGLTFMLLMIPGGIIASLWQKKE